MTNSFQTSISKVCFSWTETNKGFNLHQSAAFESRIDSLKSRKLCKVTWIQSWFANPFWQQEEWIATQEVRLYRNQRKGGKEKKAFKQQVLIRRSYSGPIQFNKCDMFIGILTREYTIVSGTVFKLAASRAAHLQQHQELLVSCLPI